MRVDRAFCRKCRYELTGLAHNVCPECGNAFDPNCCRSFTRHPRLRLWGRQIAFCLLAAVIAYAGSYYGLVQTSYIDTAGGVQIRSTRMFLDDEMWVVELAPQYRVGGAMAMNAYSPIHVLDRHLRPRIWSFAGKRQQPLLWAGM